MPSPSGEPRNLPTFFVDRSLGRSDVPDAIREAGFAVETLWTRYGPGAEQFIKDEVWIADAGRLGEVVLSKDQGFKYVSVERAAIELHAVRVFRLARADLRSAIQIAWYLNNMERIMRRCESPGPFIDVVHANAVVRQWPLQLSPS